MKSFRTPCILLVLLQICACTPPNLKTKKTTNVKVGKQAEGQSIDIEGTFMGTHAAKSCIGNQIHTGILVSINGAKPEHLIEIQYTIFGDQYTAWVKNLPTRTHFRIKKDPFNITPLNTMLFWELFPGRVINLPQDTMIEVFQSAE